jgi:hypothetical protein
LGWDFGPFASMGGTFAPIAPPPLPGNGPDRLDALETLESISYNTIQSTLNSDAESGGPATTVVVDNLRQDKNLAAGVQQRLAKLQVDIPVPGATQVHTNVK